MDQWTRDMIAEACRLDDEAIAFCGDERDHVVEKNYDDLVFKTHIPQPAAVPRMDAHRLRTGNFGSSAVLKTYSTQSSNTFQRQ